MGMLQRDGIACLDRARRDESVKGNKWKQYINLLNKKNMTKIINSIKAFFRRIAIYLVTAYANRIYQKAVLAADKRHEEEKERIYVSNGAFNASVLRTFNRKQFRRAKNLLGMAGKKDYNICILKKAAWYYTANRDEKDGMSAKTRELRRLAFVKTILRNAKLVE